MRGKDYSSQADTVRLYETVQEQPMIPLREVLHREYNKVTKCRIYMKTFDELPNVHYKSLYGGLSTATLISSTRYPTISTSLFTVLVGMMYMSP